MAIRFDERLKSIDRRTLTPLVRAALGRPSFEVIDWQYQQIQRGMGDFGAGVSGVARFAGQARDGATQVPWSLILKVLPPPLDGDDPYETTRELHAYRSGVLANLPGGVAAPRLFDAVEAPGEPACIWMEDVVDEAVQRWSFDEFGMAAYILGRFNGAYLAGKPIPSAPWVATDWLRRMLAQRAPVVARFNDTLSHPLISRMYPPDVADQTLCLWADRELFLSALEKLPRTFCHRDAFRRNLYFTHVPDRGLRLVAADWAYVGIGAVGEEIAALLCASLAFLDADIGYAHDLESVVIDSYLPALRDAGWQGDPQLVRLGYVAAAAMRYGLPIVPDVLLDERKYPWVEQVFGQPIEVVVDVWAAFQRYVLGLADEARSLIDAT